MRRSILWVVGAVLAVSLAACGESSTSGGGGASGGPPSGGASNASGRWVGDMTQMVAMLKPMMEAAVKAMEGAGGAPGADSAEAKKSLAEAKQKLADLEKASIVLDLWKDGKATMNANMPGEKETIEGTWVQNGDQVTITAKTKAGKPVEGKDAEPKTLAFKDGKLSLAEGPMSITFNRK